MILIHYVESNILMPVPFCCGARGCQLPASRQIKTLRSVLFTILGDVL